MKMKYTIGFVVIIVLIVVVGWFFYGRTIENASFLCAYNSCAIDAAPPGTDPQILVTNKAMICCYSAFANVSGGSLRDAFDLNFIRNSLQPAVPSPTFGFNLKWDLANITFQIRPTTSAVLNKYVRDVLEAMQKNNYAANLAFEADVSVNYATSIVNVRFTKVDGQNPPEIEIAPGTKIRMVDMPPVEREISRFIPIFPKHAMGQYVGLPAKIVTAMGSLSGS